ncbi:hypothetical protein AB0903_22010 [Streptomyces sp. NPDC048389]|uniref:hypothetical protein n=1 Tax=Streptomyces sp. NPDC048389 TaxID=3154622 RepID=UPI0034562D73
MTRHTDEPGATGAQERPRVPHRAHLAADQATLADARTITAPGMARNPRGES